MEKGMAGASAVQNLKLPTVAGATYGQSNLPGLNPEQTPAACPPSEPRFYFPYDTQEA